MPAKILLADDSPALLKMVQSVLSKEGYEVITAQDGIEALEKTYQENPDLIILDVIMPKITGYQLCRILKNDKETQNIPLVLLTALEQQKDKFWGLKTGADKYIPKTSKLVDVLGQEIHLLLGKFRNLPRTETLSHRKINTSEIISLVNSLLDTQLFESTIINEVNDLAISAPNYKTLIEKFLLLTNQLIRYQVGLMFLMDENKNELWVRTNIQLSQTATEEFQRKMMTQLKNKFENSTISEPNVHVIFSKDEYSDADACNSFKEFQSYFSKFLYLRNTCVGLFALAHKDPQQFDNEAVHTGDLIINQGLIIIDNARLYDKTQKLAVTDGLTELYNHRYFQEQLEKELHLAKKSKRNLSLIMIDIDHFKHFNDNYGHQAGDVILKEMARILENNVQSSVDTVARYGGEELIIILPETSLKDAVKMAENLRKEVEEYKFSIKLEQPQAKITISLGVATFPEDAKNKAELIAKADEFLYQAKQQGRNRVCSRNLL